MIEQKKVSIGKTEYVLQEFNTSDSLFWVATLSQLGSGLLLGVGSFPKGGIDSLDIHMGHAIRGLANHLSATDFVTLSKRLYQDCVIVPEYDAEDFEKRFAGGKGLDELFRLLTEIVVFNYAALMPTLKKTLAALTGVSWPDPTSEQ